MKFINKIKLKISKKIAGLLLSGLISDKIILRSTTTTDFDKKYAEELAKIAEVDIEKYGMEMMNKAYDISGKSMSQIINMDAKVYGISAKDFKYKISCVNIVKYDDIMNKKMNF